MDSKLLNKAITISAKEEKLQAGKPVVKLKDEKGLTYTVYKTKQDGSTSIAWEQLSDLAVGDTVQIGFVEDIKDSSEYGTVTYRTIRSFNKDIGNGMMNAQAQAETPRSGANNASGGKSDEFWEQQAYEKCCSLWVASLIESKQLNENELPNFNSFWDLFQAIKADGAKRFSVSELATEPTEEQQILDNELGKDIPF